MYSYIFRKKRFLILLYLSALCLALEADPPDPETEITAPNVKFIDLKEAEDLFLKNNLSLLASKLDAESRKGAVLQAGLWDNPSVFLDQNIYNQNTGVYLDTTRHGQTAIQVQQLFLLAGKRDKRIRLSKWNQEIAEQLFYDTLRSLRLELRSTFYGLYFSKKALEFYDESIPQVRTTIVGAEKVYKSREMLLSEVLRLKAILFRLETDRSELVKDILEKEASLKVLLNEPSFYDSEISPSYIPNNEYTPLTPGLNQNELINNAMEWRPDLRSMELSVKAEQTNLSLQKAMAVPDLAVGGSWDRAGNYIQNYYGFTVSTTIPVFDRNQGNIKTSEMALASKKAAYEEKRLSVKTEVKAALAKLKEKERVFGEYRNYFTQDYRNLANLMIENYRKKYITILQFADFYESYSDSIVKAIRLNSDLIESMEILNSSIGKTILGADK